LVCQFEERMANILVIDSDRILRDIIADDLRKSGHSVARSASVHEAMELVSKNAYDILVADLEWSQPDWVSLLKASRNALPDAEVIVMIDHGTTERAVEAIKLGVWDYIVRPPSLQRLSLIIDRVLEKRQLAVSLKHLQRQMMEKYAFGNIVANSEGMRYILETAIAASKSDDPVLITGEGGTGKRLIGNTIHTTSPRGREPLIFVDLSSIDQETMASVLFGSIRGIANGNARSMRGAMERADRGSIFLYEITNATFEVQERLLEFLECNMMSRAGSEEMVYVDTRPIITSSVDIIEFLRRGKLNEDLFHLISQVWMRLPPLRERKDDIPCLANHFVSRYSERFGKQIQGLSQESLTLLMVHDWPGNVRELRNAMEQAVALTSEEIISPLSLSGLISK